MIVRLCKRVIAEALGNIGIFSYQRSTEVEKFLPENEKRFHQMIRIIKELITTRNTPEANYISNYVS